MSQGELSYSQKTTEAYLTINTNNNNNFKFTYIGGGIYNIFGSYYNWIGEGMPSASPWYSSWDNSGSAITLDPNKDETNTDHYANINIKNCFVAAWPYENIDGGPQNNYFTSILQIGNKAYPLGDSSYKPGPGGFLNNQGFYLMNINNYIDGIYVKSY